MKPKTLKFDKHQDRLVAYTPIGEYVITVTVHNIESPFYVKTNQSHIYAFTATLDEAIAAAQELYNKAVLASLEPAPDENALI